METTIEKLKMVFVLNRVGGHVP